MLTGDGFPLAVQVSGRADGPTLLLLSGQANSHAWWTGLREPFEDRFRVVSFDYRGTGASRGPVGDWSTPWFAEDAAAVIRAHGKRAVVYGTSMGGRVAQHLAARHPSLVDRLILACTSPGGEHAHERTPEVRKRLASADAARTLRELFYTGAWDGHSHLFGDPTMTAEESRAHLRASNRHDAWDVLPRITAPTLVLHGTDDRMVPSANAPLLARRIPGAVLHLHEGGRHGFFDEFAGDVQPVIDDFLDQGEQ
ncbi:alpha/beta hydrolase [Actinoplanes cyaneus]|uniref:Alpha/beta hydrolase n=1 Tax=Actinoplanes cyaneus TaxID=52696 RepID=A0A919IRT1_9ACTN|nr:alpha/beta hydrolase [Actinoplanes cyaneus]MCW2139696.1 Pimeloyl-ACP methyl ester carboxylesterase [Actinoplanes cyaneus]GID69851.1 alpha/beta hydrolase [Actinoplanes cyaneus]